MPKVGGKWLERCRERSIGKALQIGWVQARGGCPLVWGTDGIYVPFPGWKVGVGLFCQV